MRSKQIEAYKKTLRLTKTQRSIIVGTLLGDGHLETQNGRKTFRLKIEHTASQKFYIDWLYEKLQDWVLTPPATKQKKINGKITMHFWFQTLSVAQFRFYGLQFYDGKGHKKVPNIMKKLLTPLALAVWFMDDGSAKSKDHRALILNTQCFSRKEITILQQVLSDRYQIESSIRTQKDGLQILVTGDNSRKFYEVIKPHILPEFQYKLGATVLGTKYAKNKLVNKLPKE